MAESLGLVVDHKVLTKWPSSPDDWDVLIVEVFPNMAAYDSCWENWAKVDAAILNGPEQERQVGTTLDHQRRLLGYQIAREALFKESAGQEQ